MILAIDTSCYTTSVALLEQDGRLLAEQRRLLRVKNQACGLRQSDAFFQHHQVLPQLLKEVMGNLNGCEVKALAASTRPRPQPGSYMPVFLAGSQTARLLSLAWACPCLCFSHQEGHLAAALWSANLQWREPFLAVHLSGGTSELLLVTEHETGLNVEIIGGCDLAAGQFIDRVGVALGLPFPAGPALEQLAEEAAAAPLRLKSSVKGADISFSGPESAAQRLIAQGVEGAALARAVFYNIAQSLAKALQAAAVQGGCTRVVIMGGVAANRLIRQQLIADTPGLQLYFAAPAYAGDNAVGLALLAAARLKQEGESKA